MSIIQGESKNEAPFTNPVNTSSGPIIQGESKADTPFTNPASPQTGQQIPGTGGGDLSAQAFSAAQAQIQAEMQAQIDPLNDQIAATSAREGQALSGINTLFAGLQPVVDKSATTVSDAYAQAQTVEGQIFAAAQQQMNQLKQNRAQEAQMMAQQIGGPVALGEFTAGFDPAQQALVNLGAGSQLHTLGYAQAGVQAAQAFSGQVFPMLRTEQTAAARNFFENQIADLQNKITDIRASAPAQTNARYTDILEKKMQYQLDNARLQLDKLNATRTYNEQVRADKAAAKAANRQYTISKQQVKETHRAAVATEKLTGKQVTETHRANVAGEKLTGKQITETIRSNIVGEKLTGKTIAETKRNNNLVNRLGTGQLAELSRSNKVDERNAADTLAEQIRSNMKNETATSRQIDELIRKDNSDIKMAQAADDNEKARIAIARKTADTQLAQVMGHDASGAPTLGAQQLSKADERARIAAGLSKQQFIEQKHEYATNRADQAKIRNTQMKVTAGQYIDAALNPGVGKSVTYTVTREVPAPVAYGAGAASPDHSIYSINTVDPKTGKTVTTYYKDFPYTRVIPPGPAIHNPSALIDYLKAHGIPNSVATAQVKQRFGLGPKWQYQTPTQRAATAKTAATAKKNESDAAKARAANPTASPKKPATVIVKPPTSRIFGGKNYGG
jgi:hypothetical protein